MRRVLFAKLQAWKDQPNRMPLLLRGARQVGKSFLIENFGQQCFARIITINFERKPELKRAFATLDPKQICNTLTLMTQQPITPGSTLLFFDEIQECPQAIQALRYFKEEMPELHVIGAGSLLEFALNDQHFYMPVGRVQFYYLKPLSFYEFLLATQNDSLAEYLSQVSFNTPIEPVIHDHLLALLRQYFVLGGMPAVIQQYLDTQNYALCQEIQAGLLQTYRNDFGKYANKTKHVYLQAIFEHAPGLVGQHFKYANVDPHMTSRDLRQALDALCQAGLIYRVFSSAASGLPLNTFINERKFKLLFLDTGLVQYTSHLSADILMASDLLALNRGQIAEQFVGQELLLLAEAYQPGAVYYWERMKPGSTAEVDYVSQINTSVIPIEVKAGTAGRLKSLHLFIQEKRSPLGVRISQRPLEINVKDSILSLPLYMIHELPRLVNTALAEK